jgi:prophage regulatory protein
MAVFGTEPSDVQLATKLDNSTEISKPKNPFLDNNQLCARLPEQPYLAGARQMHRPEVTGQKIETPSVDTAETRRAAGSRMRVLRYSRLKPEKGIDWSRKHIDELIKRGLFPAPIDLGDNTRGWIESEIDLWLAARIAARDNPTPPTPEQIKAEQKRMTEADAARRKAALPARPATPVPVKATATAVAKPDNRNSVERYLDEIAPASIVGRMMKFSKDGEFVTRDNGEAISEDVDFTALCDQTLVGYVKFGAEGEPPDRVMGLLYNGFEMPERETLGDNDQEKWELGLDGKPADPWQHHNYLVLQRGDTGELFTFVTSSDTGRRAVGTLLRHYERMRQSHPDEYPVIRLKLGGFQHKDKQVGWVNTPVFAVVGRTPRDSAAKPNTSLAGDMQDEIPF